MNCGCHGEPAYWQPDKRMAAGGWWECAVRRRELQRERYHSRYAPKKLAQQRDRYDNDPIYRITKRLHDDARRRRAAIERRRAALEVDTEG